MLKILWADDQVDVVKSFSRILGPLNPVLDFCSTGEEALEKINMSYFDLLLLDLQMPPGDWGGLWLLTKLKERQLYLVTIIVSGEGTQEETIKALRLGANDYIMKDNIDDELLHIVSNVLEVSSCKLIKNGESECVEFKSTLRMNLETGKKDNGVQHAVMKTIVAFLNSEGGVLFIGVDDQGELLGVEHDAFESGDKMFLHLINIVDSQIGVQFVRYLNLRFQIINNVKILKIDCRASNEPAYLKFNKKEFFYIRTGPATIDLPVSKVHAYIKNRFKMD